MKVLEIIATQISTPIYYLAHDYFRRFHRRPRKMATQLPQFEFGFSWMRDNERVEISRIYGDGFLLLKGDPGPWIQRNLAHRLSVRSLELIHVEKIGDSIAELAELTHLCIRNSGSLKCVANVMSLHNLQKLELWDLNLEELPANLGDLRSLTHLELFDCKSLTSLPANLGDLRSLTHLELGGCESLTSLPANLSVEYLKLYNCCRIQHLLPKGLTNLESLYLHLHSHSKEGFSNLVHAKRLRHLTISDCFYHSVEQLPENLNELPQLLLLNIQACRKIKNLPWNITNLHKLALLLPEDFRLETLPLHLNDSVIITVLGKHIRKTWKQLKQEMGPLLIPHVGGASLPMVMEAPQNYSPLFESGYLSLKWDPSAWIQNHNDLRLFVRVLELEEPPFSNTVVEDIDDVIRALPNLTHLYMNGYKLECLPDTITRLTHLSIHDINLEYLSDSLCKLSNLRSLDLCLFDKKLPPNLDLLSCLECLTLRYSRCKSSFLDHMAKLFDLKTLELFNFNRVSLPENLNLAKLKLVNSSIESLPTSLCHLEIIHEMNACEFDNCEEIFYAFEKELVNLKTLTFTCYAIKSIPRIAGLQNLQTLELKDCFSLRKLMPNMDELVQLCTLDISGTRIRSLPDCILKLPNLQHLILPKCFKEKSVPNFLRKKSMVKIEFDDMDEIYYKNMGYYKPDLESSTETSDEDQDNENFNDDNEITRGSVEAVNDVGCRESGEEGIIVVQTSPCQLQNPPEVTPVLEDALISGRTFTIGKSSQHASHYTQIQEREKFSGVPSAETFEDMIAELSSNFQQTFDFDENRQMGTMNLGDETTNRSNQIISFNDFDENRQTSTMNLVDEATNRSNQLNSFNDVRSLVLDWDNDHAMVDGHNNIYPHGVNKKDNRQKKEITREEILSAREQKMTVVEAGKKYGVSRSTVKRRNKEFKLGEWPSSRNKKNSNTKKRKTNTKSPYGSDFPHLNLVELTNPESTEHAVECLDMSNQHCSSEQVAPVCNPLHNSTQNATTESVKELTVATHSHTDVRDSVRIVEDKTSSSSFNIKATYKDDIVKFKWCTTACLEELKKALVENLKIKFDSFKMKYQDEEEDWVLINTDEHLKSAFSLIENNILRIKVLDS